MKFLTIPLIFLTFLIFCALQVLNSQEKKPDFDWPQWRGPDRNGISKETNWSHDWPREGPRLLWKFNMGSGFSPPSVSQGRVYIEGSREEKVYIYCLNAETGEKIWEYSYEYPLKRKGQRGFFCPGPTSTPTIEGNRVYAYSRGGQLFCLDSRTGKLIWTITNKIRTSHHGLACSPLIQGNLIIVLSGGGKNIIQAHDKATGKLVWSAGSGYADSTSPVSFQYKGKPALAAMTTRSVIAVSLKEGKKIFSYPWAGHHNVAEPVIIGDKVFIGQERLQDAEGSKMASILFQIPREPGELIPISKNHNLATPMATAIYWKGCLYGMIGRYHGWRGIGKEMATQGLRCVDFMKGKIKWTQLSAYRRHGNSMSLGGNFMLAGKRFIILAKNSDLIIVEARADKYVELARTRIFRREVETSLEALCYAPPVLSNQRIYCRSSGETTLKYTMTGLKPGWLLCLDVSEKKSVVSKDNIPVAKTKTPKTGN